MESLVLTRNLEAESIRSRAKSTEGCVKLKTVTKIRQRSARDTFTADSVYLALNILLDWEPVETFKQRSDVVSFMCFLVGWLVGCCCCCVCVFCVCVCVFFFWGGGGGGVSMTRAAQS